MSYKPERKYIAEIKGMTCSTTPTDTGGSFFDGTDGSQTATSFEILRDDFGIVGTGTNKRLPEAGTYHLIYTAVMDLAYTTYPDMMYIHCASSSHGYTNPGLNPGVSSELRDNTGAGRKYTDATINGTTCRSLKFYFNFDYDPNTGSDNSLYFNYGYLFSNHVNEYIYQRIEITKL